MPSWKKVIISGSNAALNSLTVTNGITGSLFGTASFATTASFLTSTTNAFIQNGNSFGTTALLGTNDNNSLALETSGSTRMFISSSGNVGINTTASTVALQIGDTTSGAGNYIKVLGNNSDSTYDVFVGARRYPRFTLEDTTVGGSAFQMWSLGNTMRFGTNTGTAENSAWYTKAGNAADVIFNGNVGIAKTTPNAKLDVSGSAIISGSFTVTPGSVREFQVNTTGVDIGNLITDTHTVTGSLSVSGSLTATGTISGSTIYSSQHVDAAQNLRSLNSSGDEGGEIFLNKAVTNTSITGGVTIDVWQNRLRFFEQGGTARGYFLDISSGSAGVGTNLLAGGVSVTTNYIPKFASTSTLSNSNIYDNSGNIGIGFTSAAYPLHVSASVSNVSIYASNDIVAFSDQSVKENIRPIENVLERIGDSRGVLYDRIDNGEKDNIGFIAQELEVAFPELVVTNEDGTKAVKYQNAVAVLFEAIKEQQKQINGILKLLNK
jgi:hypothetical protein